MAKANIVAGMSVKRPGPVEYSSDSHHCSVELTDVEIESAEHFRAVTQALFAEVKQALEAEVTNGSSQGEKPAAVDVWGASSGGNGGNGGTGDGAGQGGNGNGRKPASKPAPRQDARRNGRSNGRTASPSSDRTAAADRREADPISNKQAKFLWQLARRSGMKTQADVAGWIRERLGVEKGVYDLTKVEASKAIDILNNGNGGAKR
jgi:hypothetical protein